MANGNDYSRPNWSIVGIWVALTAQAVGVAIWVGSINAEVRAHTQWIESRNAMAVDSTLAVIKIQMAQVNSHLETTDRHIEMLELMIRAHVTNDNNSASPTVGR